MFLNRIIINGRNSQKYRLLHSSSRTLAASTTGQAPKASRQPIDDTHGEQNPHLKHSNPEDGQKHDSGKGNAAKIPQLPSHNVKDEKPKIETGTETPSSSKEQNMRRTGGARGIHTSSFLLEADNKKPSHSAETYFKDVDTSPPTNPKTRRVDGTTDDLQRPYETVSRDEPFQPPVEETEQKDERLRYGGTKKDEERDVSGRDEGPEGKAAGGMKPEKR